MGKEKLLFLTFCVEQDFFQSVKEGMDDAAALMGADCVMAGVEELDNPRQIQMLLDARAQGYDGVALNIPCMEGFDRAMKTAASALPIVGFNDDVRGEGDCRMAHVSQRLFPAGQTLGNQAFPYIQQNAHILITMHSDNTAALFARRDGIQQALQSKNVRVSELITCTDPVKSADMIDDMLSKNPDIQAVLATGQADTQGAGIVKARRQNSMYVCGFDLSKEIEEMVGCGMIDFTIVQQPYLQGFYPVIMLTNYLRRRLIPTDIDAGAIIVTKDSLAALARP